LATVVTIRGIAAMVKSIRLKRRRGGAKPLKSGIMAAA
jgi:hypothetical protein